MIRRNGKCLTFKLIALTATCCALLAVQTGCKTTSGTANGKSPAKVEPSTTKPAEEKLPAFMGAKLDAAGVRQHKGAPGIVRLNWTTQSEENNFGFNVMRGKTEKGEFKRINSKLILGAGNSSTENKYEYFDRDVKVGDVYYYFLEDITFAGQTHPFSPTIKRQINRQYFADKDKTVGSAPDGK